MSRRGDLTTALQQVSGRPEPAPPPRKEPEPDRPAATAAARAQLSRAGKHQISAYFDPAVRKQLKRLAVDLDSDIQELMGEALNDLFVKHGLPPIA